MFYYKVVPFSFDVTQRTIGETSCVGGIVFNRFSIVLYCCGVLSLGEIFIALAVLVNKKPISYVRVPYPSL